MDDFQLVAVSQLSSGPAIPGHNFVIEFYGHAVGLHAEEFDESRQRERRGRIGEVPRIPVYLKFHGYWGL